MKTVEAKHTTTTAKTTTQNSSQPFFQQEAAGLLTDTTAETNFFQIQTQKITSPSTPAPITNPSTPAKTPSPKTSPAKSPATTPALVQTKCAECEKQENKDEAPASVESKLQTSGDGQSLPDPIRLRMESAFETDFSGIKVHTGSDAVQMNKDLHAQAFTHGNDIYFNSGKYNPESTTGEHLLAHELTHTVQQGAATQKQGAAIQKKIQRLPTDVDSAFVSDQTSWEQAEKDAKDKKDFKSYAYAQRVLILMEHQDSNWITNIDDYQLFLDDCQTSAMDEDVTLSKFADPDKKLILNYYPDAFPNTWSQRVYNALYINIDIDALDKDATAAWKAVEALGARVPDELLNTGLPVDLEKALAMRSYVLMTAFQSTRSNITVDFAKAGRIFVTKTWGHAFFKIWNAMAKGVRDAIADGSQTINTDDYDDFITNKQKGVAELSSFISTATNEAAFGDVTQKVTDLRSLSLIGGLGSALGGLAIALTYWEGVKALFNQKLAETDARIKNMDGYDRISLALKWAFENGYFGEVGAQMWEGIKQNWKSMLRNAAIFIVLQFIPIVDVAVDVVVMIQSGVGAIDTLITITKAFHEASKADSTIAVQNQAGRLAHTIGADGLSLIVDLIGFASGVKSIKARVKGLQDINPALSERDALKQAAKESKLSSKLSNTVQDSLLIEEAAEITEKLGNMTPETVEALAKNPILKNALFKNKIAAFLLKKCASPCFPPGAVAEQVERLQKIMERAEVIESKMDPKRLKEFFYKNRKDLNDALDQLDEHVQQLEKAHADAAAGRTSDLPEPDARFEEPTGTRVVRDASGFSTGGDRLPDLNRKWLDNGISRIPGQIAKKLMNREFRSFDEFRETFWRLVRANEELSKSPFLTPKQNPALMGKGFAPFTKAKDAIGKGVNAKYQLDHITPLNIGGDVYNLDELYIITPKIHEALGH